MKKTAILLILFSTFLYSQNSFNISGKLKGFGENSLVRITKDNFVIDSCKLNNENFVLKGKLQNAPTGVYLQIKDGETWKYSFLFIGNENITINANKNDFPFDVKTKGSKFDNKRFELVQKQKPLQIQRDELLKQMFSLREQKKWNDSLQKAFWSREKPLGKIVQIDNEYKEVENKFVEENINSYYALYRLDQAKTQIDNKKIEQNLKKLKPEFQNSYYVNSLKSHLKYPELNKGQKYYNFFAINADKEKVAFSDFFKDDKYILLDFSTYYCGFCISAIPELEKLKSNKNLKIITFYVDSDENGLKKLQSKHTKDWNLIWDKKGRLSETYAKYKIYGTPTFYLFKPDGTLMQKFDGLIENFSEEIAKTIN
ncbi:TlpA disulfide reductase family protein [Weeksellaceae bacterium A-14]